MDEDLIVSIVTIVETIVYLYFLHILSDFVSDRYEERDAADVVLLICCIIIGVIVSFLIALNILYFVEDYTSVPKWILVCILLIAIYFALGIYSGKKKR